MTALSKHLLIALVALGLVFGVGSQTAHADEGVRFGIRPTKAYTDKPETFSYFSHELAPGAVFADEALVMNTGDVPVTLTLYAADGITAINGGTAFTTNGEEATGVTRGVNRWLFFSVTEIALEPGEEMVVPFTINVPLDAAPGHHVAGLVVEDQSTEPAASGGEGDGQFSSLVVRQAGVAVVIDVPGPHVAGLEITGTCLKEQGELGATFETDVQNRGNIFVKGEGALRIVDRSGAELASIPMTMGTVLPGDATTFQFTHPVRLADGTYLLSEVINYEGKTAFLNGVEINVKDGQPAVGCDPEEEAAEPPFSITDIVPSPERGGPWWYVSAAVAALILIALAFILLRRARKARAALGRFLVRVAKRAWPGLALIPRATGKVWAAPALALRRTRGAWAARSAEHERRSEADTGPPGEASPPKAASEVTAKAAREDPPRVKFTPPQIPEEDQGELPQFLVRQLGGRRNLRVLKPPDEPTDDARQHTEPDEQPDDGRVA